MTAPLPVTIVSGYLGAGKTTMINRMLRHADGVRIAVLVNEFGDLPIDEDLIEAREDDLISIAGGCICCSFGSDLAAALTQLAGMTPAPDHIVIEASGVALPAAIAATVGLTDSLRVAGILVLADSLALRTMAADEYIGDTITRQLSEADLILLSKWDLANDGARNGLEAWLADGWPDTPRIPAPNGAVPNAVLLGAHAITGSRQPAPHADAMYDSLALYPPAPCEADALARMLQAPGLGVIRAKGHVADVSGRMALIQIAGTRAEVTFPADPGPPGVICIGLKTRLDRAGLTGLLAAAPDARRA